MIIRRSAIRYDINGDTGERIWLWCPGCGDLHCANIAGTEGKDILWTWDGNKERPTISPSILVRWYDSQRGPQVCHSFVRDGKWEYLPDSTHALAGQAVPVVPIPNGVF